MQAQQLKTLVEAGTYKPDPSQIATAMLRRRGVRELLVLGGSASGSAGRIQSPSESPRRAA